MLANQQVVEQTGRWSSLLSVRRAFRSVAWPVYAQAEHAAQTTLILAKGRADTDLRLCDIVIQ